MTMNPHPNLKKQASTKTMNGSTPMILEPQRRNQSLSLSLNPGTISPCLVISFLTNSVSEPHKTLSNKIPRKKVSEGQGKNKADIPKQTGKEKRAAKASRSVSAEPSADFKGERADHTTSPTTTPPKVQKLADRQVPLPTVQSGAKNELISNVPMPM